MAMWKRLQLAVRDVIVQLARRPVATRGQLHLLRRACDDARRAVFPTNDVLQVGHLQQLLKVAQFVADGGDAAPIALALERVEPILGAPDQESPPAPAPRRPDPAQQRLPYKD